ncbi:hypothetical protein O988_00136 [Pseudogymnoascus sp. VKM F-3808]|nr:hypothetical protein O988_00136 [Pseudogymnoascus sp. VKM F-3808]
MPLKPYSWGGGLQEKQSFAAAMIEDEQNSFGDQETSMSDDNFGEFPLEDSTRKSQAGILLRGTFLRGRVQAAVFNIFMELCRQGACSLSSLEHPVDWNHIPPKGTCFSWILCRLGVFGYFRVDWDSIQAEWDIPYGSGWHDYHVPMLWLGTMIGRTFISLDVVFDIIRRADQLGPIDKDTLQKKEKNDKPDSKWKADINLNRPRTWCGSGTFACWLPEYLDSSILNQGFDDAATVISKAFYFHYDRMEMHYGKFFDTSRSEVDLDVQQERFIRDWLKRN